jgi:hypothetical protein
VSGRPLSTLEALSRVSFVGWGRRSITYVDAEKAALLASTLVTIGILVFRRTAVRLV